jgi:hypothetical protein
MLEMKMGIGMSYKSGLEESNKVKFVCGGFERGR